MQITENELKLILACLRAQAMAYEARGKAIGAAHGSKYEVQQMAVFARACGELSDRLEQGHRRTFIKTRH